MSETISTQARYFQRLGQRVEQQWCNAHRDEEALADIALEALTQMHPREHIDPFAVAREFLAPTQQPTRQLAPSGTFGQPAITVYHGRGFVIDLYYWTNCLSAIHNHPFCGAFCIVEGESLHSIYEYRTETTLGPRVSLGHLEHKSLSLLRAGSMAGFSLKRHPLVHTLLHVPRPSVSMVIRTMRAVDYFRYVPPGLALAMSAPDDFISRQLHLLEMYRIADRADLPDVLAEFLATADFETTVRVLFQVLSPQVSLDVRQRAISAATARHGAPIAQAITAVEHTWRWQEIDDLRARCTEHADRFFSSLLLCASSRAQVLELTHAFDPTTDPVARIRAWFEQAELYTPDETAAIETSRAMITTGSLAGVLSHLAAVFPEQQADLDVQGLARWCARSILAPLIASAP